MRIIKRRIVSDVYDYSLPTETIKSIKMYGAMAVGGVVSLVITGSIFKSKNPFTK